MTIDKAKELGITLKGNYHLDVAVLLAEIERLQEHKQYLVDLRETHGFDSWAAALVRVDKLKAENEALRQDAERYRWMRDGAGYCDTRDIPGMAPGRMDAFIDAARAREASHG